MLGDRTMADSSGSRSAAGGAGVARADVSDAAAGPADREISLAQGVLGDARSGATPLGAGGMTLESLLQSGTLLPLQGVVRILGDLAVQIDDLHMRGIAYDALSPAAVEVTLDEHARLLPIEEAPSPGPGYLAPERRHGYVTMEADQYSLGIIAWELITGRRRETHLDGTTIAALTELEVGPSRVLRPGVGPGVNAAIERATNASVEVRYKSAGAFVSDIAAGLDPNAPRHTLLQPVSHFDEPTFSPGRFRRASGTGLGRVAGLFVGTVLAVSAVAGAAWLAGGSSGRFWRVPDTKDRGGFDWFGLKPKQVVAATQPVAGAAASTGYVSVSVDGGSAEVLIDGSVAGRSPILVPATPGPHMIQVRSGTRRFEPAAVTVQVAGADTVSAVFRATP
jgi:hypothetical protein